AGPGPEPAAPLPEARSWGPWKPGKPKDIFAASRMFHPVLRFSVSAARSQEKQGQGTGAGARPNDGAGIGNRNFRGAETAAHLSGHPLGIVQAVSMADEHRLAARVKRRLLHFLHQRPQSGP